MALRTQVFHGDKGTFVLCRCRSGVPASDRNAREPALKFRSPHTGSVGLGIDRYYGSVGGSSRRDYRSWRQDCVAARCLEGSSFMDSGISSEPPTLKPATSGFVLAAALTVVFSTALACAKDTSAPLKNFMKSLTDHDWTTHGLVDLFLFAGLGFFFMKSKITERMSPSRLIGVLDFDVASAAL